MRKKQNVSRSSPFSEIEVQIGCYTYQFRVESIVQAGQVVLGPILKDHQVGLLGRRAVFVAASGSFRASKAVFAAGVVVAAEADVGAAIGLHYEQLVFTTASVVGTPDDVPVRRDLAYLDAPVDVV